jgi:hypothetical protein
LIQKQTRVQVLCILFQWIELSVLYTLFHIHTEYYSRDRAVGIATGYGLDGQRVGVRGPAGARIFTSIHCVPGALSLGVKRPGREAHHSSAASAEVKKTCLYIHSPIRLMA